MSGRTFSRTDIDRLRRAVNEIVDATPVTDIHTHLYAPAFGPSLLWGVDELLTYHYLVAEFFRAAEISYDAFWALGKTSQAETIWKTLFQDASPISEACRGVLTVLHRLGLDVAERNLAHYRGWFAEQDAESMIERVFATARLKDAVMTNDPFDDAERPVWEGGYAGHPRFHAALRIDPLLNDWTHSHERLKGWGFDVEPALRGKTAGEVRRFLSSWAKRTNALYMAVSLPPDFAFPEDSPRCRILEECVLPVALEHNLPFAMMIGVTRQVNPALRLAGDGVGTADVTAVERLCAQYPHNKFMLTMLSRENQHACCIAARKFRNLLLFGCWWFLNDPSLIEEISRMRFELLGPTIIPQHSDARVLEQVIYKWDHSREILARVLADKYADLARIGWTIEEGELRRDISNLLGGNFWRFLERSF